MAHSHSHSSLQGNPSADSNIRMAFFLNLGFSIIEIIGGFFTNSIAIISDALHDLGDSFSLAMAWYFQRLSKKKRDWRFSYGYKRFSVLGALINSLVLLTGSIFIIYASIQRLIAPQETNARGMLILAVIGILFNGLAMLRLKKGKSLNERAVALHLLEDVLGWIAVLIASIVMMFFDLPILDPLLSLAISCYILFNIYRNIKDVMKVMLQGVPNNINEAEIRELIASTPGVQSVHDLHIWTMDGEYNILTTHIILSPEAEVYPLKQEIKEKLKSAGIHHPTIEIEQNNEPCGFEQECC